MPEVSCKPACAAKVAETLPNGPDPATPGSVAPDYEYHSATVCNETTNTWQEVVTPYVDGVAGTPVTTDLGVPCDQPQPVQPDIEKIEYCNPTTNTMWIKVCQYSFPDPADLTNVVETVFSDTDTGVKCNEGVKHKSTKCVCKSDDINNDGSVFVKYFEGYIQEIDDDNNFTSVFIGNFSDEGLTTPYTIQGTSGDCKEVANLEIVSGCDDSGTEISRHYTTYTDGTTAINDYINGVLQVTNSPSFTASKDDIESDDTLVYATNTDAADAEHGRVVELSREDVKVNGQLDPLQTKWWDKNQNPAVDLTSLVTVAPYQLAAAPVRVQLTGEQLIVLGGAAVALAAIPATATYAEIYIDAPDANIRWTKDASAPADNNGEQEATGGTIRLLDRPEIDGFRALPIDGAGALDPTLTANLTINYWNIAPDED